MPPIVTAEPVSSFGDELRDILAKRRLSQARAGYLIGCDHSYLSRVIAGSRNPTKEFVEMIRRGLDLDDHTAMRLVILGLTPTWCHAPLLTLLEQADDAHQAITFRSSVLDVINRTERGVA